MSQEEYKLLSLTVWRKFPDGENKEPILLSVVNRLDLLGMMASMWYGSTIKESILFGCRTVVHRTALGHRCTITMKDLPFDIHCHVRSDGLACCVIASQNYPPRVAFGLAFNTMTIFEQKLGDKWLKVTRDQFLEPPFMKQDLETFQNPNNDQMNKIQNQLNEVKDIMRQNIEEILKRGETLDDLLEKSTDLSESSKQFYEKSAETNSCWRRWGCEIM